MRPRSLYLAGPDVFYEDALSLGRIKKEICARYGFEGLFPLDNEIDAGADKLKARREIYQANIAMIRRADAVVANMTPFKGIDADPGTAFEVGYAAALGKTAYLYTAVEDTLVVRHERLKTGPMGQEPLFRAEDFEVEDLGGGINLMMLEACFESGGALMVGDTGKVEDLELFERLITAIAESG